MEVLAALIILGLLVSSLLKIRSNSIDEAILVKNSRKAWELARTKYGELRAEQDPENIPSGGNFPDHEGYSWETSIERKILSASPPPNDQLFNTPADEEERRVIFHVVLKVFYPGPEEEQSIKLIMYRLPPDDL